MISFAIVNDKQVLDLTCFIMYGLDHKVIKQYVDNIVTNVKLRAPTTSVNPIKSLVPISSLSQASQSMFLTHNSTWHTS